MTEITGSYFILNNEFISSANFNVRFLSQGINVYEVLRFTDKVPILFENHFERLTNSSIGNKLYHNITPESILKKIEKLLELNNEKEGNIKIVLHSESENVYSTYIYQTPHNYPSENDYIEGIKLISIQESRPNPNLKSWRPDFKKRVHMLKQKFDVFDTLLIEEGIIKEGSQSNFFAIIEERIITAPGKGVLRGITREIVFQICHENKIDIVEMDFSLDDLNDAEAVFLTGTSPGIIPVSKLDKMSFPSSHPILTILIEQYKKIINKHIS